MAAAAFGVEMAVSGRYGYVRDELYFLAAGRHLAWGYVDQPSLTPLLARIDALLTGDTLVGLRALPALGLAALVLLTAAMARALGAGRGGQLLAALATACCAEYLGAMHELTTTPVDFVGWALVLLAVTKLLTRSDPRWWIAVGGLAGLGMDAKWNIGFLVAALGLGFAVTPAARPLLRSRYLACAAVLFAVLAAPDFAWQALHGWPNVAVFGHLNQQAWQNRALYWPIQVVYTSIALVPLWVGGIAWALRDARLRVVGVAAVAVIVAQFVLGGKGYYPGGVYTFCFAAGATRAGCRPAAAAAGRGLLRRRGRERGDRAAAAARRRAGPVPGAEGQLRPGRGDRVAVAGSAGRPGVRRAARPRTGRRRRCRRQLRRGGRGRPVRGGARAAAGRQRRQQLLAVGTAARPRYRRRRRQRRPGAAAPLVQLGPGGGRLPQRPRGVRRRGGRGDLRRGRPARALDDGLAAPSATTRSRRAGLGSR